MNPGRKARIAQEIRSQKILIVADDPSVVDGLREVLLAETHEVISIPSAAIALETNAPFEPDLVLLDIGLKGSNVFHVCQSLRNRYGIDGAPILFIASKNDSEEVVMGLGAGAVDFLFKPFRKNEILARIRVHALIRQRLLHLSATNSAKSRLISVAAHDLRNPIVSIRALAHSLRTGMVGEVTPEQRDLLDTLYDASQSTLELLTSLLDVSRLEAGQLELITRPVPADPFIASIIRLNQAVAAEKGSAIVWQRGPLPTYLLIDEQKIRQVLNNLLSNAVKFSPPKSIISVGSELSDTQCILTIRDQGPGIPEGEQEKLFGLFSRTSTKPTAGESSTGLGLFISYQIMQAHYGDILLQNIPGEGAEFRVVFPLTP